jgi:hypothetical protein
VGGGVEGYYGLDNGLLLMIICSLLKQLAVAFISRLSAWPDPRPPTSFLLPSHRHTRTHAHHTLHTHYTCTHTQTLHTCTHYINIHTHITHTCSHTLHTDVRTIECSHKHAVQFTCEYLSPGHSLKCTFTHKTGIELQIQPCLQSPNTVNTVVQSPVSVQLFLLFCSLALSVPWLISLSWIFTHHHFGWIHCFISTSFTKKKKHRETELSPPPPPLQIHD